MKTQTARLVLILGLITTVGLVMPAWPAAAAPQTPALTPTPVPGAPAGVFSGAVQVTSVSVLIRATDAAGRPVTDLRSDEVEVREDGVPADEVGIEPLVPKGRAVAVAAPHASRGTEPAAAPPAAITIPSTKVTVYLQADLLNREQLSWAIKGLRNEADKLVTLGPMNLVVADPDPTLEASEIKTTEGIDEALDRLKEHSHLYSVIERIRRDFRRNAADMPASIKRHLALQSTSEELRRVGDSVERLRSWNSKQKREGGRVLVLASSGFELDPWAYYSAFLDPQSRDRSATEDQRVQLANQWQAVSQELVGNGWTVLGFSGGMPAMDAMTAAETSGHERFASFVDKNNPNPAGSTTAEQGTTVSYALDPLRQAARDSGGEVAVSPAQLAGDLTAMESAYVLSYTMSRPPDSGVHHLQVTIRRAGVSVLAPTVTRAVSPHTSDRERVRALLSGHGDRGEVPFEVEVTDVTGSRRKGYSGRLVVTGHLGQVLPVLLSSKTPRMEVSVGVDTGTREPFVSQGEPMPLRLADQQGTWIYESPIQWPAGAKAVAVVVSETTTDTWGGGVAELGQ